MTRDEIFALFNRRETAWQARDAPALTADHAPDGVVVSPTGGVLEGRSRSSASTASGSRRFPTSSSRPRTCSSTRTACALLCRITGSHAGEFFGMPPTGRRIEVAGAFIYRLQNGLIAHERRILDFTGLWCRSACCGPSRRAEFGCQLVVMQLSALQLIFRLCPPNDLVASAFRRKFIDTSSVSSA